MGPNWKYFLRLPHLILSKVLLFFTSDCFIVFFSSAFPFSPPACLLLLKSSVTEIPFPLKILEDVVCLRIFSLSLTLLKVATIGLTWKIWKGQLILKANCQAVNSSKKQMNSFLQVCDVISFVFWKKLKTPKRHFEIIWPLISTANQS